MRVKMCSTAFEGGNLALADFHVMPPLGTNMSGARQWRRRDLNCELSSTLRVSSLTNGCPRNAGESEKGLERCCVRTVRADGRK